MASWAAGRDPGLPACLAGRPSSRPTEAPWPAGGPFVLNGFPSANHAACRAMLGSGREKSQDSFSSGSGTASGQADGKADDSHLDPPLSKAAMMRYQNYINARSFVNFLTINKMSIFLISWCLNIVGKELGNEIETC